MIEARDEPEAIAHLRRSPAVVLTDLELPIGHGFGVLRAAREFDPDLQVVVVTAHASVQDAVAAMKEGARDFLVEPVDPDQVVLIVERAIAQRRILAESLVLNEELAERRGAPRIVGADPRLRRVSRQLHRAAGTDATVLLEGESGTGKELFARALHALSPRAGGPFVAINCAAIPEGLLESELFGYERGAFTGAVGRKPGRFETAHRGTLFLDEVGDLPLGLQAKILRALEDKQFERVGGTSTLQVDARVVAATNRDLRTRVAEHEFREDLYFRLSVFPITIPPLRERTGDVVILARHFVERSCRDLNRSVLRLSPEALDELQAYAWPGNVRELQNCIERAVILCDEDTIHRRHLNLSPVGQPGAGEHDGGEGVQAAVSPAEDDAAAASLAHIDLSGTMTAAVRRVTAAVERLKVEEALRLASGNKERAAEALHVSYRALLQKQREYGIGD